MGQINPTIEEILSTIPEDSQEVLAILDRPADETVIYNLESQERYEDARIIGGNPNGIININQSPHRVFHQIFMNMQDRDWNSRHINIAKDARAYNTLTPDEKRMYDLALAQLITNDSIQTMQLPVKIMDYVTSRVATIALARQTYEEALHAESYTRMAEDICGDTNRIYNMHNEDEELRLKNQAVAEMYSRIYPAKGEEVKVFDIFLAFVANQILEELVFPGGFAAFYALEPKMIGTGEMISEINIMSSLATAKAVA